MEMVISHYQPPEDDRGITIFREIDTNEEHAKLQKLWTCVNLRFNGNLESTREWRCRIRRRLDQQNKAVDGDSSWTHRSYKASERRFGSSSLGNREKKFILVPLIIGVVSFYFLNSKTEHLILWIFKTVETNSLPQFGVVLKVILSFLVNKIW
jgi:hypothetical protein